MVTVFTKDPGALGSISGQVIPKAQKWNFTPPYLVQLYIHCFNISVLEFYGTVESHHFFFFFFLPLAPGPVKSEVFGSHPN